MSTTVDVIQPLVVNDDLFDAELEDSDGAQEDGVSESDVDEKQEEVDEPSDDEADEPNENELFSRNESSSEDAGEEESINKIKNASRRPRSPKPRRLKKAAIQAIHSESQRMVRESLVKLPYHQPAAKPISHFLKRVAVVSKDAIKLSRRKQLNKDNLTKPSASCEDSVITTLDENSSSPLIGDTVKPDGVIDGVMDKKVVTPKLSSASDPFFFDETPTPKLPVKGMQSLMQRFMKHKTKPSPKIKKAEKSNVAEADRETEETEFETPRNYAPTVPLVPDNKIETNTPGSRLNILKQQLENKMKFQRAEMRKIHESQRKLDNEEISEEEEDITDEESDSDYEVDKWNEIDERKQEEGSDKEDGNENRERNAFVDEEAQEDDDDGIDSGSEGDVSDEGESDDDKDSVFSDIDMKSKNKEGRNVSKITENRQNVRQNDEETLDLFNYDSRSQTESENSKVAANENYNEVTHQRNHSDESSQSLCLRLESMEDEDEILKEENTFTKTKEFKSPASTKPIAMGEVSQESSQSSLSLRVTSDFEGSSDSSRIPAAQGEGTGKSLREVSGTPQLLSLFPRIADHMNANCTQETTNKKPGKLSQLTLPIEDSQDLFDEDTEKLGDDRERTQVAVSSDFHFSLDEDTQFTQMLDTQGYLFSSKKSRKPKTKLLFGETSSKDGDTMDEILGLCSGKFSGTEFKTQVCNGRATPQSVTTASDENSQASQMDELLGLCSGKFGDDEDVNIRTQKEKEFTFTGSRDTEESDIAMEDVQRQKEKDQETEDVEDNLEEESDSEIDEEIHKRKYGKTYGKAAKIFDKKNFLEKEAELSGSDVGSDEDDDIDTDDDVLEEDSDQEELPSDEELQKQINKVHMKSILDQDKAELRLVKEMYLQDGDLYTDGDGRKRNFRWRGIDENSQLDLFDKRLWGDDDGHNVELLTEEESKKRKERFEKDTFLREEMNKADKESVVDMDESSQNILNFIKDTSSASTTPKPQQPSANPAKKSSVPKLQTIPSRRGSFLNRSKATLTRLSSITANTPNASASGRTFVFQSVSAVEKEKAENSKKMPRTVSMIEPAAKRPKLDRSMSETPSGSIFAML